jgi:hypothetical protein
MAILPARGADWALAAFCCLCDLVMIMDLIASSFPCIDSMLKIDDED